MKNKKISGQRGVTLTALVITVTAILILTSVVLYNAKNDLKLNKLRAMKNDISNLRDKVSSYYAKYGDIPAIKNEAYTNIEHLRGANIIGANDTGSFYVIDLKALENLTLNYGKDYEKIKNISTPTPEQINSLADIYIINADSQNIFYVQGIEVDGYMYYTDYTEKDVDKEILELVSFTQGSTILPGHLATEKEHYINNGEAVIPKGFIIVPGCDDVSKGLVISDNANDTEFDPNNKISEGNQFVWIPVTDMSKFVRQEGYYNGGLSSISNNGEANANGINEYLQKNGLGESDVTKQEAIDMYKSIEKNKGFYIGRYETSKGASGKAEVKKNKQVWNNISWSNINAMNSDVGGAVEKARNMYTEKNTYEIISTLCYGVQWDAALRFIDANYTEYAKDSTGKGNYSGNLINTGSNDTYAVKNIYDMAGNAFEWTMESYSNDSRIIRGGSASYNGISYPSSSRGWHVPNSNYDQDSFRVTLFIDDKTETLPSTTDTIPYLPTGATVTNNDLNTGLTIKDAKGNEWVWIEVPKSIYDNEKYKYYDDGTQITKKISSTDYSEIEAVMHKYTETYRNGTIYTDTWSSDEQHGLTKPQYYELKNKMLESVYKNGGFYIGKYEVGTETLRNTENAQLTTPVIKEGAYPYNYVTNKQAQQKATDLSTGGKTSSLMFGVQWDLVLKHIETKGGKRFEELTQNSSSWGNYYDTTFVIEKGEYSENNGDTFTPVSGNYSKNTNKCVLLTTGATERNSTLNIYNLAGNVSEWTLEYTSNTNYPCAFRGGVYDSLGSGCPSSSRYGTYTAYSDDFVGFRPALY